MAEAMVIDPATRLDRLKIDSLRRVVPLILAQMGMTLGLFMRLA